MRTRCTLAGWIALVAGTMLAATPRLDADDVVGQGAQVVARDGVLNLRTGDVRTADLPNFLDTGAVAGPRRAVIQLDGPLDPARAAALDGLGIDRLGYLPLNAFITDLSATTGDALRALGFVTWAGAYLDEWKVDASLLAGGRARDWANPQRVAMTARGELLVDLWLFAGAPANSTLDALARVPGAAVRSVTTIGRSVNIIAVLPAAWTRDPANWRTLADLQWADELGEYAARSNQFNRGIVQTNTITATPFYDRGLTGAGEVAGVIDGWVAVNHCSFADTQPIGPDHRKILAYNTVEAYDQHGTHVAATLAGDGGNNGDTRGVAYGAKIVFNTWPDPTEGSMYDKHYLHVLQGASVHSNSWGDAFSTAYDGPCRALDALQHEYDDTLILFAVTNGPALRNPENAKNVLAVAATAQSPNQDNLCSGGAGPTIDGRRKPEITAPGCNVNSSSGFSGCGTGVLSGTSMAAPAVSGVGILLRQYFVDGFYPSGFREPLDGFAPSGSLLKAMLINSAVDMTAVSGFPNNSEGWGRVWADRAAYFAGDVRRLAIRDVRNADFFALETTTTHTYPIDVLSVNEPFKVTVAWADSAAQANATFAPVNNLDLEVVSPFGQIYRGNVFSNGVSVAGGSGDTLNNLEQVLIPSPQIGRWQVRIVGRAVNEGPQGYALVTTGVLNDPNCIADFDRDGGAGIEDLLLYLVAFDAGSPAADVDDGSGLGRRDGGAGIEDFLYFLQRLDFGC